MKIKKTLLATLLAFVLFPAFGNKSCYCDIEDPFVTWDACTYNVYGNDCCESPPGANSGMVEHNLWNGESWETVQVDFISGTAARDLCCNPNN